MSLKGNQVSSKGTGNAGIRADKLYQFSTDLFFSLWFKMSDTEYSGGNPDGGKDDVFPL